MLRNKSGFTIVELLVVIVVIAILAAISVTAYTGIQDRANFTKYASELKQLNTAILTYKALNGSLPYTGTSTTENWRYYCDYTNPADFIPGLTTVTSSIPAAPCTSGSKTSDTWVYGSDGSDYKLLYVRAKISTRLRFMIPTEMRDPERWDITENSWGYWSNDAWGNT